MTEDVARPETAGLEEEFGAAPYPAAADESFVLPDMLEASTTELPDEVSEASEHAASLNEGDLQARANSPELISEVQPPAWPQAVLALVSPQIRKKVGSIMSHGRLSLPSKIPVLRRSMRQKWRVKRYGEEPIAEPSAEPGAVLGAKPKRKPSVKLSRKPSITPQASSTPKLSSTLKPRKKLISTPNLTLSTKKRTKTRTKPSQIMSKK